MDSPRAAVSNSETSSQNIPLKGRTDFRETSRILAQRLFAFELRRVGRPDELARRICHLAIEGERDPVRLHDRALVGLIPATIWRELS
jgi:hypothetical protein